MKQLILIFLMVSIIGTLDLFGQIPMVKTPQPATFSQYGIGNTNSGRNNPSPNMPTFPNFNKPNQSSYEQDRLEVQRRNAALQQILSADFFANTAIQYDLPSVVGAPGTENYRKTAQKLLDMLNGKTPLNLKEAVFLVENAYFEGQLDRKRYENSINDMAIIAQIKAKEDGYNWNNPTTKNLMLFRTISDTLKIKLPLHESSTVSLPMQYDFEDFRGENNWENMFVTKLLVTHKGQCHSLPLLYLILCEATGAEANLAYSPSHSYIKFKDKTNNWYNIELTNGHLVTDAYLVGSGFITAEAIKNKIYLEPQTKKQVIAQCLSDLSLGYIHKYGYDGFVSQCTDSILKHDPKNLSALLIKANYQTRNLQYVIRQTGTPPLDTLKIRFPKAYELLNEVKATYKKIDDSGFREMPKDAYESWLNAVNEEKEKQEHNEKYNKVLNLIR
jgi:hypothetical protein